LKNNITNKKYIVTKDDVLIKFLRQNLTGKGLNKIKSLIRNRKVSIDNCITTFFTQPLHANQIVTISNEQISKEINDVKIVYEDDFLIVIDKPAGLLTISAGNENELTAFKILSDYVKIKNKNSKIFIVHRLDKLTSGLLVFAKSEIIKNKLQNNWNNVVTNRKYSVIIEGKIEKPKGVLKNWLKESKALKMFVVETPDAYSKQAITNYELVMQNEYYSMLSVELDTGRKNQIRVQFANIGHPVIGDKKYGSTKNPIKRIGLHAKMLEFIHPILNQKKYFESQVPSLFFSLFKNNRI